MRFYWRDYRRRGLMDDDICMSRGWLGGNGLVRGLLGDLAWLYILVCVVVVVATVIRRRVLSA